MSEVSPQSQTLSLLTSFGRLVILCEIKTVHTLNTLLSVSLRKVYDSTEIIRDTKRHNRNIDDIVLFTYVILKKGV